MLKRVTILLAAVLLLPALDAAAQTDPTLVTIRQIQEIPEADEDILLAAGANVTEEQVQDLIFNEFEGQRVQFTAVVLSDPKDSGLASVSSTTGRPGRVNFWVRDTSAASMGLEGMGLQVVAGNYVELNLLDLNVGDVVTFVGEIAPFRTTMQLAPEAIEVLGRYSDLGFDESILAPVPVTTADINRLLPSEKVQIDWEDLDEYRDQYVRLEGATVIARTVNPTGRVDFLVSTDGGQTVLNFYDTSGRFRNDAGNYPDPFNARDPRNPPEGEGPFTPPPPGSVVNIQGFISTPGDDPFNRAEPTGLLASINPIRDEDFVVLETPPVISNVSRPTSIPGTAEPVIITADVVADAASGRTLQNVVLRYGPYGADPSTFQSVAGTQGTGDAYSFSIPAQADNAFISYFIQASDNEGGESETEARHYRVLSAGVDEIADIQTTPTNDFGASAFVDITADVDLTATVMTGPAFSGGSGNFVYVVQDDPDLGPWSGILVRLPTDTLVAGDVIHITRARIEETADQMTRLDDVTYESVSTGEPYAYKTVTTTVLQDDAIAEAHESMLLRFDDVVIVEDSLNNFGEWTFASAGTDDALLGDDAAIDNPGGITSSFVRSNYEDGDELEFVRGVLWYSFGDFKLQPITTTDFGAVVLAIGGEVAANGNALRQSFPNPARGRATISFDVARAGGVRLELFDLLGRQVATLVDGQLPGGTHTATVDARGLASGMYVYRLTAGTTVLTRTLIVVK